MITPPLEAQYAAWYGWARSPATEAMVTMLPLARPQVRQRRVAHQHRPGEVDAEVALPGRDVEVLEPPELVDAGHVDQHVEPAELARPRRPTAAVTDAGSLTSQRAHAVGLAQVDAHDRGTLLDQEVDDRAADPARRPGDQCALALEPCCHVMLRRQ